MSASRQSADEAVTAEVAGLSISDHGTNATDAVEAEKSGVDLFENFTVDASTYSLARISAVFYPKFENEKSDDQEIRNRMTELVSNGLANLEVSLKHSGSLFMYAGNNGGAYAKNSFGNEYTAVGVFVLWRMFREAWGSKAEEKGEQFNDFIHRNRICVSMELVTAVLGDHGQRPREDYVVVTSVTELGNGKPEFYPTQKVIAFCREWRLPTNQVWLFSTGESITSFFAAYDMLCEEGIATSVCRALDKVADMCVPGSIDHVEVQGEILEGLVGRIVSRDSLKHMEKVLKDHPPPLADGARIDLGPSLREIFAANGSDEKQLIKALLQNVSSSFCPDHSDWYDSHLRNAAENKSLLSKFLQARPADYSTAKLQEMIPLMRDTTFKCYHNFHKVESISSDNLSYKMVIHVRRDSAFRRYQKEMRQKPGLWPLYRGFFLDISLFKANEEQVAEIAQSDNDIVGHADNGSSTSPIDGLGNEDANLMIKLKFLPYKVRTFLIRNGLLKLFKDGPDAYMDYYQNQMQIWGTSEGKKKELSKMLDEWAEHIRGKCGDKQLSEAIYLSEAEPFLEQYASEAFKR